MKRIASHALLIAGLTMVGLILWACCGAKPTEEQRAKRRAFEEKLANMEKLHAERIRAQKEAEKQKNASSTENADKKKDEVVAEGKRSVTAEDQDVQDENQTP